MICNFSQFYLVHKTLYMFQAVPPPIIRSKKLYIQLQEFVRPMLVPAAIVEERAVGAYAPTVHSNQFHLFHDSSRYQHWSDKYLTLYVQFCAPDDGQRNRLKHVERLVN